MVVAMAVEAMMVEAMVVEAMVAGMAAVAMAGHDLGTPRAARRSDRSVNETRD